MKRLRFVIRALAILFGISALGVFVYGWATKVSPGEAKQAAATYAQQCRVSSDQVERIFGESAAQAAQEPVAEVKAKLLAEYKLQTGQASFADTMTALKFKLEKALGYDPEQAIQQIAIRAGIKALKDDLEKCRLAGKGPSFEQVMADKMRAPLPAPAADIAKPAPLPVHQDANAVLQEAARQAEETSRAKWQEIQANPTAFLDQCEREGVDMAVRLGGIPEREARAKAKGECVMQLTTLRMCMKKPSAQAASCFQDVFERGD